MKKDATGSDSELNKSDEKSQEEKEETAPEEVTISLRSRSIKFINKLDLSYSFDC
jgi:hypothetical protein